MAREKASINLDIWADASFRDLTDAAQALYFKLMTSRLDYCGVGDFRPGRLAAMTREQTADQIVVAAQELSDGFWIVCDQSTEEFLVRGYLRHDGVLRQPKLAVSAALAYAAIASPKIRAVVVYEVQRFRRENPELAAWEKPQMKTLLKQPATPVTDTVTDLEWTFGAPFGHGYDHAYDDTYGQLQGVALAAPTTAPTTATATATATDTSSKEDSADFGSSYPHPVRGG